MEIAESFMFLLYDFEPFLFHIIAFVINSILVATIAIYGAYLYRQEKRIRDQSAFLKENTEKILSEANQKAMDIIVKSNYLTDSIKSEIKINFENILKDLEIENKEFYMTLAKEYEENSQKYVEKLSQEGKQSIKNVASEILQKAKDTEEEIEDIVKAEISTAEEEIKQYKNEQKTIMAEELRQKLNKVAVDLLPGYLSSEAQEKLIQEAIEKSFQDKV